VVLPTLKRAIKEKPEKTSSQSSQPVSTVIPGSTKGGSSIYKAAPSSTKSNHGGNPIKCEDQSKP